MTSAKQEIQDQKNNVGQIRSRQTLLQKTQKKPVASHFSDAQKFLAAMISYKKSEGDRLAELDAIAEILPHLEASIAEKSEAFALLEEAEMSDWQQIKAAAIEAAISEEEYFEKMKALLALRKSLDYGGHQQVFGKSFLPFWGNSLIRMKIQIREAEHLIAVTENPFYL